MNEKIEITEGISINPDEFEFTFVRASGPGGQNINKVSSAVQLRFNVARSATLPDDVKRRLIALAGRRATQGGVVIIEAKRFRHQIRNKEDAIERLTELIKKAARKRKSRRATTPTTASKKRRLEDKKRRGQIKRLRGGLKADE